MSKPNATVRAIISGASAIILAVGIQCQSAQAGGIGDLGRILTGKSGNMSNLSKILLKKTRCFPNSIPAGLDDGSKRAAPIGPAKIR